MADGITVEVKGLAEIRRALLQLPKEIDVKTSQSSLLVGARQIRDRAIELAPQLAVATQYRVPGTLKRNIRMARARQPAPGMTATVIVGVRKFNMKTKEVKRLKAAARKLGRILKGAHIVGNPFYWRFMEFGFTDRAGNWHGPHNGRGYLRAAFEDMKNPALTTITKDLGKRVDKIAKKLGFRTKRDFYG